VLGAGYLVKMPPAGSDLDLEIEILDDPEPGAPAKCALITAAADP
jgi:hypothetical protein